MKRRIIIIQEEEMPSKICKNCGTVFYPDDNILFLLFGMERYSSSWERRIFCKTECKNKYLNKEKKPKKKISKLKKAKPRIKICINRKCNKEFKTFQKNRIHCYKCSKVRRKKKNA